jgi:putative transposase
VFLHLDKAYFYLSQMDWATRRILAWRLSNSLTMDFCIDAVEEAIERYGPPQIFNTDQGVQFTSGDFVRLFREQRGVALSMDGKGCWRDNVMIERF